MVSKTLFCRKCKWFCRSTGRAWMTNKRTAKIQIAVILAGRRGSRRGVSRGRRRSRWHFKPHHGVTALTVHLRQQAKKWLLRELSKKLDKIKKHYATISAEKLINLKPAKIHLKTEMPSWNLLNFQIHLDLILATPRHIWLGEKMYNLYSGKISPKCLMGNLAGQQFYMDQEEWVKLHC